jgi:Skp family chaperone for outer membrane proteins
MNRKLILAILPFALGVFGLAQQAPQAAAKPATPAANPASSTAPTKIGVVDIQAAILATNEGRREFDALQKKYAPKQTELQKLNQEVEDLRKQLQAPGSKLTDDARNNLVRDMEAKQKSLQRKAEDAQTEFQQERDEIASKILQKLGPVLADYAKKQNFAVILDASQPWPQGQVVWAAEPVDVTQEVVEAYNTASGTAAPASAPNAPSATKPTAPASASPSKPPAQ